MLFSLFFTSLLLLGSSETGEATPGADPVLLVILARSRAHSLPLWLGFIENLDYPKSAISVFIQTDHNQDNTPVLLSEWAERAKPVYKDILLNTSSHISYSLSNGPSNWDEDRYVHLMRIRQSALDHARKTGQRYVFFVDTDNFLTNPATLTELTKLGKTVVAPLIRVDQNVAYANYWAEMTTAGYYKSVPHYFKILRQEELGTHKVPMVHSVLLIDLQGEGAEKLRYHPLIEDYTGPMDDIIHFAINAQLNDVPVYVNNEHVYGWMTPRLDLPTIGEEIKATNEYIADFLLHQIPGPLPFSSFVTRPTPSKLGFDEIYLINLVRRPERRDRMVALLDLMGIQVRIFDAVDGKQLTQELLDEMGVRQLPGYEDPYHKRALKFGEIGCFLSHYRIWEEVVTKKYQRILILEDDVRFEPNFSSQLNDLMAEVEVLSLDWDLIYLARKILQKSESWVPGSSRLVVPKYSYWTASYMLSNTGARKLLKQGPAQKMIAVDEYLPLMFDAHPNREWSAQFEPRDLIAYSVNPLLIEPQFYIGQTGYISDTETSTVIAETLTEEPRDEL